MRLFLERGYDATTVAEVAEAAEVSAMTVYRHFPTKEHLVLRDEYDEVIVERIRARPAGEPVLRRVAMSLLDGLAELPPSPPLVLERTRLMLETPALRARLWESQYASQQVIVAALEDEDPFEVEVAVAACMAAAGTAVMRWAGEDGRRPLGEVMAEALGVIVE